MEKDFIINCNIVPPSAVKVTVLLNRRGVVSFEQLLLDISEALGFPRWHRARVTRLYTTHAREVRLSHGPPTPRGKNTPIVTINYSCNWFYLVC